MGQNSNHKSDDKTHRTKDTKENLVPPFSTGILPSDPSDKSEAVKTLKCSILKFVSFINARDGVKNTIVKEIINPQEGGYPWYHVAKRSILGSLAEQSYIPIEQSIHHLKNLDPEDSKEKSNLDLSIKALEKFKRIDLPLEFRDLKKTFFKPSIKEFNYLNFTFTFGATCHFFKSKHHGKEILGAVMINCRKKTLSPMQMISATFLLHKFLKDHLVNSGQTILPESCICIDVFGKKCSKLPAESNFGLIKTEIIKAGKEFEKIWLRLTK